MSFKLFIYYCALCGGWAAFLSWLILVPAGIFENAGSFLRALILGGLLGMLVAAAVGVVDSILNSSGTQRIARAGINAGIGLLGGLIGSGLGQLLAKIHIPLVVGWMIVGTGIGASVGLYDYLQAKGDKRQARKKMLNGIYGGLVGGFIGGLFFGWLFQSELLRPRTSLAFGLVILGCSIGLMIGLAQVMLKEAWVKIEVGKRAGKELIISKDEITIGRAETCDLGLFGEKGIEKVHARIRHQQNRYVIHDEGSPDGTFVNEQRISQPTLLQAGDTIELGSCVLRFGEREKKSK